jgi:hypothetical protein
MRAGRLTAEHGNLDTAQRRLVRANHANALRLMTELSWFWRLRGLHGGQVSTARELLATVGAEPPAGLSEEYVLCLINAVSGEGDDLADQERLDHLTSSPS